MLNNRGLASNSDLSYATDIEMDDFMEFTAQQGHMAEVQRLRDNHDVVKADMGRLLFAPVDFSKPGLKVLDSAAADGESCLPIAKKIQTRRTKLVIAPSDVRGPLTSLTDYAGTWLNDLRQSNPSGHEYVGIDINDAIFPEKLPRGFSMHKHSFTDPWPDEWSSTFDFVHQKFAAAGAGPVPLDEVIGNLAGLLKPGGWMELVELSTDPLEATGPVSCEFLTTMRTIFSSMPAGPNFAIQLKSHMSKIGLVNIQQRIVNMQTGIRARTPELIAKSINGTCGAIPPILAVAKRTR